MCGVYYRTDYKYPSMMELAHSCAASEDSPISFLAHNGANTNVYTQPYFYGEVYTAYLRNREDKTSVRARVTLPEEGFRIKTFLEEKGTNHKLFYTVASRDEVESIVYSATKAYRALLKEVGASQFSDISTPDIEKWFKTYVDRALLCLVKNRVAFYLLRDIKAGKVKTTMPFVFDEVPVQGARMPKRIYKDNYCKFQGRSDRNKYSIQGIYPIFNEFRTACGYVGRVKDGAQGYDVPIFDSCTLPSIVTVEKHRKKGYEETPYIEIGLSVQSRSYTSGARALTYVLGTASNTDIDNIDKVVTRKFCDGVNNWGSEIFRVFTEIDWYKVVRRRATMDEVIEMLEYVVDNAGTPLMNTGKNTSRADAWNYTPYTSYLAHEQYYRALRGRVDLCSKAIEPLKVLYKTMAFKVDDL